ERAEGVGRVIVGQQLIEKCRCFFVLAKLLQATALIHARVEAGDSRAIVFVNLFVGVGGSGERLRPFLRIFLHTIGHFFSGVGGENLGLQKILSEAIAFFDLFGIFLFVERRGIRLELCP